MNLFDMEILLWRDDEADGSLPRGPAFRSLWIVRMSEGLMTLGFYWRRRRG